MERESAVREILQSIGPMFPDDAEKARAARKEAFAKAEQPVEATAPVMTAAPKPMLASQIDNAEKTEVANLAEVLRRLAPSPPPTSLRDAVPELVRRVAPDAFALRAALILRESETPPATAEAVEPDAIPTPIDVVEPVAPEAIPVFTELPSDTAIEAPVEEVLVQPEDVIFLEPSAEEIQAALAEAIEAQRDPSETVEPASAPPAADSSEDEQDAFVYAIADAILPARPYPPVAKADDAAVVATVTEVEPVAPAVQPVPIVEVAAAPVDEPVLTPAPTPVAEQPKPKFKRAKPKKAAEATTSAAKPAVGPAPAAKEPEPQAEPAPSTEDDELVRQIRVHRDDMVDVDDQIARIDQEIAAEQQAMAQSVSAIEQKNAHLSRLLRLRTNTQRFVETLQMKAEPVRRTARKEKKSA